MGTQNRSNWRWTAVFSALILALLFTLLPRTEVTATSFSISEAEIKQDYEAFWQIMLESYPMLDLLRSKGVEVSALQQRQLPSPAEVNTVDAYRDWYQDLIEELCQSADTLGHLSAVRPHNTLLQAEYDRYYYVGQSSEDDPWLLMQKPVFANKQVLNFYSLQASPEVAAGAEPCLEIPDNLRTEIKAAENWAYCAVNSFLNEDEADTAALQKFFTEIEAAGIENCLIDVRGNLGGYNSYWLLNIVAPNIKVKKAMQNYGLYKSSPWTASYEQYYTATSFTQDLRLLREENDGQLPQMVFAINPARRSELPDLPRLQPEEVASLDRCLVETFWIYPTGREPLFTGKFYVLVDEQSYSASEYFVSFCKRSGFATVIGRPSAGDGACVLTLYVPLPASGLLIRYNLLYGLNPDGSSSEEQGTSPDILLAQGEDARQHCLELIAAGNEP